MSQMLHGTDYSWLAVDASQRVGWFTMNGSGPVPKALGEDPDELISHEEDLASFVRARGRAFEFGAGDTMWRDAASVGIHPFDFDGQAHEYRTIVVTSRPVLAADLPADLQRHLTVRLPTADFTLGRVTAAEVAEAASR